MDSSSTSPEAMPQSSGNGAQSEAELTDYKLQNSFFKQAVKYIPPLFFSYSTAINPYPENYKCINPCPSHSSFFALYIIITIHYYFAYITSLFVSLYFHINALVCFDVAAKTIVLNINNKDLFINFQMCCFYVHITDLLLYKCSSCKSFNFNSV